METFQRQRVDVSRLPAAVVEKWSAESLTEGFVPFPKKLVRCLHRLFPEGDAMKQVQALLAIVDFKRPNLSRPPSLSYLAFLAGLSEPEFQTALRALEEKRYARVSGDNAALTISLDGLLFAINEGAQS